MKILFQVEFQAGHGRGYRTAMSASMLSKERKIHSL